MAAGSSRRSAAPAPFRLDVRVEGAQQTLAAFRALPKDASDELRTAATALSTLLASKIAAAGQAEGRQAAVLAQTVKPKRDRIPALEVGGTKKLFKGKKDGSNREAFRALFGSEFGSNRGHGFKRHVGKGSYWIWRTVEENQAEIAAEWHKAADGIIEKFTDGGSHG